MSDHFGTLCIKGLSFVITFSKDNITEPAFSISSVTDDLYLKLTWFSLLPNKLHDIIFQHLWDALAEIFKPESYTVQDYDFAYDNKQRLRNKTFCFGGF